MHRIAPDCPPCLRVSPTGADCLVQAIVILSCPACLFEAPAVCAVSASPSSRACWRSVVVGRVEGAAPDHVREDGHRHNAPVTKERVRGDWGRYGAVIQFRKSPFRTSRYPSCGHADAIKRRHVQIVLKIRRSHVLHACVNRVRPVTTASICPSARACPSATP